MEGSLGEWQPLLSLFLHAPSPVGAAIHWVLAHGYGAPLGSPSRKRPSPCSVPARLWRFVPELLARKVLTTSKQDMAIVGNCLWMQTLPAVMQGSILTFLSAQHCLFRPTDLELLARGLLASSELDFWVARAAENLLCTVLGASQAAEGSGMQCTATVKKEMVEYECIPDWLQKYKEQHPPLLPWLTQAYNTLQRADKSKKMRAHSLEEKEANSGKPELEGDEDGHLSTSQRMDCPSNEQNFSQNSTVGVQESIPMSRGEGTAMCSEINPTTEIINPMSKELMQENASQGREIDACMSIIETQKLVSPDEEEEIKALLGADLYARAQALREALLGMQQTVGTVEDINLFWCTPDSTALFTVIKPWEMEDDVTLFLVESLLGKEEGYVWSSRILSYVLLPKVLALEQSASRILISAVLQASKFHPRAAVDALLLPIILCEQGLNVAQCDIVNRTVKECLPDDHLSSLMEKIVLQERRQKLQYPVPKPVQQDFVVRDLVWTEPACMVVHNLLNQQISLDQETMDALVAALEEVAEGLKTSLKFGNLLLSLITKHGGARLKQHKGLLQRVVGKTNTFMTKSVMAKLSSM